MLSEQYQKPSVSVKVFCTSCMTDRIITQKGKCKICGWKLLIPQHWDSVIRKLELIERHRSGFIPLEIKKKLYFIPYEYLDRVAILDKSDYSQIGNLVEEIKTSCISFKV